MIKKENKLIQITLDPETLKLLNTLADRFHISKTETIKQALKIYGSTKKHHYTIYLNDKETSKKTMKELYKEIENETIENETEDKLPFDY